MDTGDTGELDGTGAAVVGVMGTSGWPSGASDTGTTGVTPGDVEVSGTGVVAGGVNVLSTGTEVVDT